MSHNRDLSAAAAQIGFHSSNIGIGSEAPRYALDVYNSNLLVSGPSAGNIILEDRGVGDSSRPFHVVSSDGGKFVINRSNRSASGTTTSSVNSLTLNSSGNLGLGQQTSPAANIHIGDISGGYELKVTGNALQFNRSSNSYIDQLHDTGSILFRMTSSNTEAMRITSAGNIGVGVANPTQKLMVKGIIASEATNSTNNWMGYTYTDNTFRLNYNGAGSDEVTITSSGLVGINDTTPDAPLSVGGSSAFIDVGAVGGNRAKFGYSSSNCIFGVSATAGEFLFKNNCNSNENPVTAGTIRMRINGSGQVTTPDQPAFNAKLSTATGQNYNGILVFNTVQYNIGSHYNGTNGRFTAPVDGRYLFNWYTNVDTNSNTTSLWGDWLLNGNYSGFRFYTYVSHGGWELLTASIIFDLNANDYVNVFVSTSGNYDGGQYGSFNGCLLG